MFVVSRYALQFTDQETDKKRQIWMLFGLIVINLLFSACGLEVRNANVVEVMGVSPVPDLMDMATDASIRIELEHVIPMHAVDSTGEHFPLWYNFYLWDAAGNGVDGPLEIDAASNLAIFTPLQPLAPHIKYTAKLYEKFHSSNFIKEGNQLS